MSQYSSIAKSTIQVMFLTFIGFVLGLIVQILIANKFGASKEVDAFVIATIIPQLLYGITNAVLMTSLVVVLTNYVLRHNSKKTWQFVSNVLNISFAVLLFLALLVFIFAPLLAKIIAPGFGAERLGLTIKLIRILSITILFYGLSSFTTGIFYTKKYFILPALFKPIISFSMIISIFLLISKFQIFSLAIGVIIGTGVGFFLQFLMIRRQGMEYTCTIDLKNKGIRKIAWLSGPLVASSFLFYINKYVNQIIASLLPAGNIAILNYAFLLVSFPVLFFGNSISTVIFPSLTQHIVKKDIKAFKRLLMVSIRILIFIFIPCTFGFFILGGPLVRLLFEHGMFSSNASLSTILALFCYSIGLVAFGVDSIVWQAFSALEKMKIRLVLMVLMVIINITLSLIFIKYFSFLGLAIASSLTYILIVPISFYFLDKLVGKLDYWLLSISIIKILFASILAGILTFCIYTSLFILNLSGNIFEIIVFVVPSIFGIFAYFIFARILKLKEFSLIKKILKWQ